MGCGKGKLVFFRDKFVIDQRVDMIEYMYIIVKINVIRLQRKKECVKIIIKLEIINLRKNQEEMGVGMIVGWNQRKQYIYV